MMTPSSPGAADGRKKKALEKRLEEAQQSKGNEGEVVRGPDEAMRVRMKQVRLRKYGGM